MVRRDWKSVDEGAFGANGLSRITSFPGSLPRYRDVHHLAVAGVARTRVVLRPDAPAALDALVRERWVPLVRIRGWHVLTKDSLE